MIFFQPHPHGNIIQLLPVDHFAPHFGEKAFFAVRVALEQIVGDQRAEDSVAEIFQPFIVFVGSFANRPMSECRLVE